MTRSTVAHQRLQIDPSRFPALAAFVRGYLHQDLAETDGTPAAAAAAFARDATAAEREALRADWTRFATLTAAVPLRQLRRAFAQLGAAWVPATRDEVRMLDSAIRGV